MSKKEPSSTNTVSDYKDTAQEVIDAAIELRGLVTDVRGLLESETLSGHIEDVNNRIVGAIDQTAVNAQGVTNLISWRMIQLTGAIFLMALSIHSWLSQSQATINSSRTYHELIKENNGIRVLIVGVETWL
jgi:hypothetical protein